jgi:beta-aspartyl-peptidase (threonine type)
MIIVGSSNGLIGIKAGMAALKEGQSAIDAVEIAIRAVEDNPKDHSVGYGGLPNFLGEVRLDASIMDGRTLAAGAVAAMGGYRHPISVARKVMEELPHVLLVGDGAERFAAEMGFERSNLLTDEARRIWWHGLHKDMPGLKAVQIKDLADIRRAVRSILLRTRETGTVNFIVQDAEGNFAAGVSTSGWEWSYPGRVGDSPIIGAGAYADNRFGAAASTGLGEIVMRFSSTRSIILYLKVGMSLQEACIEAQKDLQVIDSFYARRINIIALDKNGHHAAVTGTEGTTYIYMTEDMIEPEEERRILVCSQPVIDDGKV